MYTDISLDTLASVLEENKNTNTYKPIGFSQLSGTYTPDDSSRGSIPYDNCYVHCIVDRPARGRLYAGAPVEVIKVKTPLLMQAVADFCNDTPYTPFSEGVVADDFTNLEDFKLALNAVIKSGAHVRFSFSRRYRDVVEEVSFRT